MIISPKRSVGIIGGVGKTGSQFAKLFRSAGFDVRVTGEKTKSKNVQLIETCDIILFALPLSSAAEIMKKELSKAKRKDQLILDLSSLKVRETEAMKSAAGEVIGMHPLFGPATDPTGERIILCPVRASRQTVTSLRSLLKKMKLNTEVMTPKAHDELMLTVQVVPHLKSLLMADVLSATDTDLTKVLKTCTPTYEMEFNVIARFLDDHPDLYMPIIFRNPDTPKILRALQKIIAEYLVIAESGDLPIAEKRYRACQTAFQPHLKKARAHSEACIRTLLSLTR